jgi:hypothetical protein
VGIMSLPIQDTSHDLEGLVTHDEIRYCKYCEANTEHRVGVHTDHYETDRYIMDKIEEYAHCQCGNTATVMLKKEVIMKVDCNETS